MWQQIYELHQDGFDIGNHSTSRPNLITLSRDRKLAEVNNPDEKPQDPVRLVSRFTNTVEKFIGSEKHLPMADCRTGIKDTVILVEHVVGQDVEFRTRIQYERSVVPSHDVKAAAGQHDGSIRLACPIHAVFVESFTCFDINTVGDAIVIDPVEVTFVIDG